MTSTGDTVPLIALDQVSKRFGGTQALSRVSVTVLPGEVHALVGENGAGKSTLGKVIAGVYTPDAGSIARDGRPVTRWDTVQAQRHGVVMMAQEIALVPDLTVEQNVFLGIESSACGLLRRGTAERFAALDESAGFGLAPKSKVRDLRIADLQKVEIMRALARDAKVIVMDEPTSSLTSHETARLHELIDRLRREGRAIVYVSHFLDAVTEIGDRVTIMRDGHLVRTRAVSAETKQGIISGMLGRELSAQFPPRAAAPAQSAPPSLEVRHLASPSGLRDASLVVRPGEIVGILGLVGSGRSELARALVGADRLAGGEIRFHGKPLRGHGPREAMRAGMVLVPEDRHAQGLVLQRSIRENVTMAFLGKFSSGGVISGGRETRNVLDAIRRFDIRPARPGLDVQGLSGGNQQKTLLAKWLIGEPSLVILDEPTRGVDVGAKFTIYKLINELAAAGTAVLLISSEHEEVLNLSHRAYLVSRGKTIAEVDPAAMTVEALLRQLFAAEESQEVPA